MTSINNKLVSVFQLLQENDSTSNKFSKLGKVYGLIEFNTKRLTSLHNDFVTNSTDFKKLRFFTNTSIVETYESMTEKDQTTVSHTLQKVYEQAKETLFTGGEETHTCESGCSHDEGHMEKMLGSKKMQKMLKKKGVRQQLTQHLGKQFNMKNANLEDMLKNAMKDQLPEEQMNMVNSVLSNPMVKNLSDQLMNEENMEKIKTICMNFIGSKEVVDEINKIRSIFNEDKLFNIASNMFNEVQSLDDISKLQDLVENNTELQGVIKTFEKAVSSGLIDQEKLMALSQKAVEYFMTEFKNLGVLDTKNMGMLSTLMGQFGGDLFGASKPEKKSTKSERRAKAQKKYRREQRKKLKNNRRRS